MDVGPIGGDSRRRNVGCEAPPRAAFLQALKELLRQLSVPWHLFGGTGHQVPSRLLWCASTTQQGALAVSYRSPNQGVPTHLESGRLHENPWSRRSRLQWAPLIVRRAGFAVISQKVQVLVDVP